MIDNLITVYLPDREIKFREPSFNDYKSMCKMLVSTESPDIQKAFNDILDSLVINDGPPLSIVDKFLCIITIRNTILGNELSLTDKSGRKMVINLGGLLVKKYDDEIIEESGLSFKSPLNFLTKDIEELITECLVKIYDTDVSKFSIEQKLTLVRELDAPLATIYKKLLNTFYNRVINITKDISFSLYGEKHTLSFLRDIFMEDLFSLLNFQFTCIRHLGLNGNDFNVFTYPECKIFLNHLVKERKSQGDPENNEQRPME